MSTPTHTAIEHATAEQLADEAVAGLKLDEAEAIYEAMLARWRPGEALELTPDEAALVMTALTRFTLVVGAQREALVVSHLLTMTIRRRAELWRAVSAPHAADAA